MIRQFLAFVFLIAAPLAGQNFIQMSDPIVGVIRPYHSLTGLMHYEKAPRFQKVEAVMGGVTAMVNRVRRNRRRT